MNPQTPDGRFFVVKGRLWRCSNPMLAEDERRAVRDAKKSNDGAKLKKARAKVHVAKVALGERGPVWWDDGAPDLNRRMVVGTEYACWYETCERT